MDLHLKQWRDLQTNESEVDEHPSVAKFPRLLSEANNHYYHHHHDHNNNNNEEKIDEPALPLFVPEPASSSKINCSYNLSAYSSDCSTRFPITAGVGGGGYFSMAQWQELELQAVIFRHMMAGAAVPPELLQLIKKSPSYYFHQQNYPFYQPTLLQAAAGYWGRGSMDPEPGRCRRTDGKKWRCSRDVVPGQKYCERHVHRGRNRSRKPVEFPTNTTTATAAATLNNSATAGISYPFGGSGGGDANDGGVGLGTAHKSITTFASPSQLASTGDGSHFSLSGPNAPFDVLQINQGSAELKRDRKGGCFDSQHEASGDRGSSSGRVLRHFFDDWPRGSNHDGNNTGPGDSAFCLSISTPGGGGGGGGNSTSDFLKLSTGNGEEIGGRGAGGDDESGGGQQRAQGQLSWNSVVGWGANHHHHHHQMGGPLAEALRSSAAATTNDSSPTSVLHQLQRCCSASADTNYVSA